MTSEAKTGLGRRRELLVYTVIFVITGGSLFDIITDREHWPFSPYPMFSRVVRDHSYDKLELLGVTEDDPPSEISLTEFPFFEHLNIFRLSTALEGRRKGKKDWQSLESALQAMLEQYEVIRRAGGHRGPPLRGIRLYRYYWQLDPRAHNIDRPNRREVILEVTEPVKK